MIVICEQCQARFTLDEKRIPAGGARVRCSLCKHAFFLPAPGGDEPDLLDELISQTAAEPLKAPPPSEDLEGTIGLRSEPELSQEPAPAEEPSKGPAPAEGPPLGVRDPATPLGDTGDQEWEFNEEVPSAGEGEPGHGFEPVGTTPEASADQASGLELAPRVAMPSPETPPTRQEAPVARHEEPAAPPPALETAEEGNALDWTFDDEELEAAATAEPAEACPVGPAAIGPPALRHTERETSPAAKPAEVLEAPERVGLVLGAVGWLASAALAAVVAFQLLWPSSPTEAPVAVSRAVGPLIAESLRGRFVDNLFVGPLLVVTADLHNPGDRPISLGAILRVVLLDAEGRPVPGARAALAPAAEREIREQPPEVLAGRLAERGRALAAAELGPGQRRAVSAVFADVPLDAVGLELETGPLPLPLAPGPVDTSEAEPADGP